MRGGTRRAIRKAVSHKKFPHAVLLFLIFIGLMALGARESLRQERIYGTATVTGLDAEIVIVRSVTVPGEPLNYNVKLVNNLDEAVPFNIAVYEPIGWMTNYQKYVEVPAGKETEVGIEITPPKGVSAGEYQFEIIVRTKAADGWKKVL